MLAVVNGWSKASTYKKGAFEKDQQFDIIDGAAGCICTLLCLYNCVPDEGILAIAVLCGDHLIHHAKPMEVGIGWITGDSDKKASIGFSHGVAGILSFGYRE